MTEGQNRGVSVRTTDYHNITKKDCTFVLFTVVVVSLVLKSGL